MCCFSRPVESVSGTKLFARFVEPGLQALVYGMRFSADEDLAMVLPIPVARGSGDDAVRFVDLSDYPAFFADLDRAFPQETVLTLGGLPPVAAPQPFQTLEVHDVGDFEASFAPSRADFSRLDRRFRLSDAVFDAMPQVADFGFAVFKLKATSKLFGLVPGRPAQIHPMAFVFPTRSLDRLFFPTLHVHDGRVHDEAAFDHTFYAQGGSNPDWRESEGPLGDYVRCEPHGLVDPRRPGQQRTLLGYHPNRDQWLEVGGAAPTA